VPLAAPQADVLTWNVRAIVGGRAVSGRVEVPVSGATVARVLSELNIEVGPLDRVFPAGSSAAYNGMAIRVKRVAAPLRKRMTATPFETRYLPTSTLRPGKSGVVVEGQSGTIEITERVWSIDGKVSRREYVSHRVARAPQMRIVGLGARSSYVPGRVPYHKRYARAFSGPQTRLASRAGSPRDRFLRPGGTPLRAWKVIELVATGYSPDPRENGGYTVTATGLPIGYGAAATDPRVIPLGTKMYVEGYGYAFACDVGGAIKGRRIDLAYNSYREANTKGRKKVRVWLLAE
jgi:3D (Asp-Asp-Asp) domain-containing protein